MSTLFGSVEDCPEDIGEAVEYYHDLGIFVVALNMSKSATAISPWKSTLAQHKQNVGKVADLARSGGGVGMRLVSNLIIVDLDVKKDLPKSDPAHYSGLNELTSLMVNEDPGVLDTVTVLTPNGHHLYYRSLMEGFGKTCAGQISPSIDLRVGPTGIVALPPSFGKNFVGRYRFDKEFDNIQKIPLFLSRRMVDLGMASGRSRDSFLDRDFGEPTISDKTTQLGRSILRSACGLIERAPRGTRNQTIYDQAFQVFRAVASGLISIPDAESNLYQSSQRRSMVSGKGNDVPATIDSAKKNGITKPYSESQKSMMRRRYNLAKA